MTDASDITIENYGFGTVEIAPDSVIEFPMGLVGIGGHRYTLIANDADGTFLWLHSLDDPGLALPVTNPHRFFADYEVELADADVEHIGVGAEDSVDVYVTVRASSTLAEVTANLKAPILVRDGRGHQVINQAPGAELRAQLFPDADVPAQQAC